MDHVVKHGKWLACMGNQAEKIKELLVSVFKILFVFVLKSSKRHRQKADQDKLGKESSYTGCNGGCILSLFSFFFIFGDFPTQNTKSRTKADHYGSNDNKNGPDDL